PSAAMIGAPSGAAGARQGSTGDLVTAPGLARQWRARPRRPARCGPRAPSVDPGPPLPPPVAPIVDHRRVAAGEEEALVAVVRPADEVRGATVGAAHLEH